VSGWGARSASGPSPKSGPEPTGTTGRKGAQAERAPRRKDGAAEAVGSGSGVEGGEQRLVVTAEEDGLRLDLFLERRAPGLEGVGPSRAEIVRRLRAGGATLAGRPGKASRRVSAGEVVRLEPGFLDPPDSDDRPPPPRPDLPISVLHADEHLIVVDKAAGRVVHPAPGHADDSLVNALLARFPDLASSFDGQRPGIVHRLDRDTTGVMVVARTAGAAEQLQAQFKDHRAQKVYLALARGAVAPPFGVIDAPLARDPGRRQRMAVVASGRAARTIYRVHAGDGRASLLLVSPVTGRTHQIRVHLRSIGHPVVGDAVYGRSDPRIDRPALHAWRLALVHPGTGERVEYVAPVPDDFRAALEALGFGLPDEADAAALTSTRR